ncbi:MAG: site-specific DNA-methyltransferase, partial [Polyangiaceae bacterium]|nr:site-specific DNA-methyltransferase [Polyangiaceae bacterium]
MTGEWTLINADVADALRNLKDNGVDALFCDPPYGFGFMGKAWDYDVPSVELWTDALRVLKPGAPLVAFGGSRTYHRLACNVEDAGFELRDCLMWLYSTGFPKSQNVSLALDKAAGAERLVVGTRTLVGNCAVSAKDKGGTYGIQVGSAAKEIPVTSPATELAKAWDGYGTALKPAHEPIVLARKPLDGTMAENVARWGVGGLAIDACRIEGRERTNYGLAGATRTRSVTYGEPTASADFDGSKGRWPANLLLDEGAAAMLNDGSRFFFTSKVSTKEREAGCEALPLRSVREMTDRDDGTAGLASPRAGAGRGGGARNHHPTLKPIALTTWLARFILPPSPGMILVPFSGAGSEMIGCLRAGWPKVVGIERDPEYAAIARAR